MMLQENYESVDKKIQKHADGLVGTGMRLL